MAICFLTLPFGRVSLAGKHLASAGWWDSSPLAMWRRFRLGMAHTRDQKLDLQRDALKAAGCSLIIDDQGSGTRARRPGLDKALDKLGPGVVLVVWRLDRLGRSLSHLVEALKQIKAQGEALISLTAAIDTTSAGGRRVFHMNG